VCWQRAHIGEPGNEAADTLAKASVELLDTETVIPYAGSYCTRLCKESILADWQSIWHHSDKGRFTYEICQNVSYDLKFKNQVILYFVTGKGSFPSFLFDIGKRDDANCPCGAFGNSHHFVQDSCSFIKQRIKVRHGESLYNYYRRIDKNKYNMDKINLIYNKLNMVFSFISSVF
jgi:hypothetical protein